MIKPPSILMEYKMTIIQTLNSFVKLYLVSSYFNMIYLKNFFVILTGYITARYDPWESSSDQKERLTLLISKRVPLSFNHLT